MEEKDDIINKLIQNSVSQSETADALVKQISVLKETISVYQHDSELCDTAITQLKERVKDILSKYQQWINKINQESPMMLETDGDDLIEMFLSDLKTKNI